MSDGGTRAPTGSGGERAGPSVQRTGGVRIGSRNASWPLARLSANSERIEINATVLGRYSFLPQQVAAIKECAGLVGLSPGIQIYHNRSDYPPRVIFWCMGSAAELIGQINAVGFEPQADPHSVCEDRGMPVRPGVIAVLTSLWVCVFAIDWFIGSGASRFL